MKPERSPRVLVAGAGVAAVEAVLALQDLAGDRVTVELLAPDRHFTYRPLGVGEPFHHGSTLRMPLAELGLQHRIAVHHDTLARVRADDHVVETLSGTQLEYDVLVLALGARMTAGVRGATTFRGAQDAILVESAVGALRQGTIRRLAFAVPDGTTWTLTIYELALQTACAVAGSAAELTIVTPEPEPLAAFGPAASALAAELLAARGVALRTNTRPDEFTGSRLLLDRQAELPADRVISLPGLAGPRPRGVPSDPLGFVPVDEFTRVLGADDIYAVGDAAAQGIKQGGLATQQADVAAAVIAAAAGASVEPRAFSPVLRAVLLTGDGVRYLRGENGDCVVSEEPLWWPPAKIAGRRLGPYLATLMADKEAAETRS